MKAFVSGILPAVCVFAAALCVPSAVDAASTFYADTVLADDPVGYWQLEQTLTTDTVIDSADAVGSPQDGSQDGAFVGISGTLLGQQGPSAATSIMDRFGVTRPLEGFPDANLAVDFDGSGSDRIVIDDSSGFLNFTTGKALTLEAWANGPRQLGGTLVAKGTGNGGEQYQLGSRLLGADTVNGPTAYWMFSWNDTSSDFSEVRANANDAPNETWQHVVAVYDISDASPANHIIKIYLNGQEVTGSTKLATTMVNTSHEVSIGNRKSSTTTYNLPFDGLIDEVAIYDYALSTSQIEAHFDAAFAPEPGTAVMMTLVGLALLRRRRR